MSTKGHKLGKLFSSTYRPTKTSNGKHWKLSDETREKIRIARLGTKRSEESKRKQSIARMGLRPSLATRVKMSGRIDGMSANWKGDEVGYTGLHMWVVRKLGAPSKCEHCETSSAKKFEWANKSQQYKRNLEDWIRLCTSCHRKYDNEIKSLSYV